jgi:hypothetical protein
LESLDLLVLLDQAKCTEIKEKVIRWEWAIFRADILQLVRTSFYWCSNQRLMMSVQTVGFYLFIRSGRGASLSQHDCLNLTIVSFHSISSNSLKIGFGRSTLEGRLCESWKFFTLPYITGITKEKISFTLVG